MGRVFPPPAAAAFGQCPASRACSAPPPHPAPTENAINNLIETLALDPSVNVRLTALEALYALADQAAVRAGVLVSLPRETSPLVQVAMIDFLAATRDREAAATLENLSTGDGADPDVRAAAQRALTEF